MNLSEELFIKLGQSCGVPLLDFLRTDYHNIVEVRKTTRYPRLNCGTLFFRKNIDVRLCRKHGSVSLRTLYNFLTHGKTEVYSHKELREQRDKFVADGAIDSHDQYQLRRKSTVYCVTRDPVERAVSTTLYLYSLRAKNANPSYKEVVDFLDHFTTWDNVHLYTQSYWMGSPLLYDRVYKLSELNDLQLLLSHNYETKLEHGFKLNVTAQKLPEQAIRDTQKIIEELPTRTVQRIKRVYERDYDEGWHRYT